MTLSELLQEYCEQNNFRLLTVDLEGDRLKVRVIPQTKGANRVQKLWFQLRVRRGSTPTGGKGDASTAQ